MRLILFSDGGSRGNPGPAAYGFLVRDLSSLPPKTSPSETAGIVLEKCGKFIGEATNNQAEYRGLIAGLGWLQNHYPSAALGIYLDSLLVVNQIKGRFRVKNISLRPLFLQAKTLLASFPGFTISHLPREENTLADSLANQALDQALYL